VTGSTTDAAGNLPSGLTKGDRTVTSEQQTLLEMPIWLVIVLALLGGLSGEMWRADKEGARGWALVRRLLLRSGACMVCGVSTVMLLYASGMSIWSASAFGCLTAMAGADMAIGLYERWAARRMGMEMQRPDIHHRGHKKRE